MGFSFSAAGLRPMACLVVLAGVQVGFEYRGNAQPAQTPFGGIPWSIPGTIEIRNFDEGGEGVSYHDTTMGNQFGEYRNTDVDISSPYVRMREGEWLEYTVNIAEAGTYDIFVTGGFGNGRREFHLLLDGVDLAGPIALPQDLYNQASGREFARHGVVLKAGLHHLRFYQSRLEDVPSGWFPDTFFGDLRFVRSTLVPSVPLSGNGQSGFKDGPPDQVQFSTNVTGLDVDLMGNIYVADSGNYRVRKVSPSGHATTLAGNGTDGTANGPGDQARFSLLRGIAGDDAGNCYVTDGSTSDGLNKIRKVAPDGNVSTLYSEARETEFISITLNSAGEIYFTTLVHRTNFATPYVTISRLSAQATKTVLRLWYGWSSQVNAGHSLNVYWSSGYYEDPTSWALWSLEADVGFTLLYATPPQPRNPIIHGLVADRSGNVYFSVSDSLTKRMPSGGFVTIYSGVSDALAADISGDIYAFENDRLIKLLVSYRGLGLTAFTDGGGTVKLDPPGPMYVTNTVVRAMASPSPGWTFRGWTNDISAPETNLTLTMTNHVSLQALFGTPLQIAATNGTVLRNPDYGSYAYGSQVQLTARPNVGFEFIRWSDGATNPVRTVKVTEPIIGLSASFSALPKYSLSVAALGGVGGTVSRSPDQAEYFRDTPVIVTAHPARGYVFQVWLDNVLDNPRTVVVRSNTTLFAAFAQGQGTAPQITSAPQSTGVLVGGQAILTVAAQGSSPLEYQWQFKGTNIPGAVAPTLILSGVQTNQAGPYTIIVSNSVDTATAYAVLTVYTPLKTIETVSIQSDKRLHLMVSGDTGSRYQIDRSEDLANWEPLTVLTNTTGLSEFAEPIVEGRGQRFYRALLLPSQ